MLEITEQASAYCGNKCTGLHWFHQYVSSLLVIFKSKKDINQRQKTGQLEFQYESYRFQQRLTKSSFGFCYYCNVLRMAERSF
jgi:hypothetical protein